MMPVVKLIDMFPLSILQRTVLSVDDRDIRRFAGERDAGYRQLLREDLQPGAVAPAGIRESG